MDKKRFSNWCRTMCTSRLDSCDFRREVGMNWERLMEACPIIKELEKRLGE